MIRIISGKKAIEEIIDALNEIDLEELAFIYGQLCSPVVNYDENQDILEVEE